MATSSRTRATCPEGSDLCEGARFTGLWSGTARARPARMLWFRMTLLLLVSTVACDKPRRGARDQNTAPRAGREVTAPKPERPGAPEDRKPEVAVHEIADTSLCVTKGKLQKSQITAPTFRAVAPERGGDAAQLQMIARNAKEQRALASGQLRRQVGLKLRAADACNLVYVMWRLDPKPMLEVSTKVNPGLRNTSECGTSGYTKVKPSYHLAAMPELLDGNKHVLRAEIAGDSLTAWVDDRVAWQGSLPADATMLAGVAGVRSDNLEVEVLGRSESVV